MRETCTVCNGTGYYASMFGENTPCTCLSTHIASQNRELDKVLFLLQTLQTNSR